jgi:hypothetical protein
MVLRLPASSQHSVCDAYELQDYAPRAENAPVTIDSGSIQVKLYGNGRDMPQNIRLLVYDDQQFSWPCMSALLSVTLTSFCDGLALVSPIPLSLCLPLAHTHTQTCTLLSLISVCFSLSLSHIYTRTHSQIMCMDASLCSPPRP